MSLFSEEEVCRVAERYALTKSSSGVFIDTHKRDFKAGVEFAEGKITAFATAFLEWTNKYGYVELMDDNTWGYWDNPSSTYTTKELFEEFLKQRK
jgi:hypothetical protein